MNTIERWTLDKLREAFTIEEMMDSWPLVERWFGRGDGVAVYQNQDLGHPDLGLRKYMSYGSMAAMLETDTPPEQLPDMPGQINWRYRLIATCRPADESTKDGA